MLVIIKNINRKENVKWKEKITNKREKKHYFRYLLHKEDVTNIFSKVSAPTAPESAQYLPKFFSFLSNNILKVLFIYIFAKKKKIVTY